MQDLDITRKRQLLAKSFIFEALGEQTQTDLAALGRVKQYMSGDAIFHAGDAGQSMMAIAQGEVRISTLSPTAKRVVLTDLSVGDVFGEIALLDGGERSADAHASTNCTMITLDRSAIFSVLNAQPELALKLVAFLCARIRRSDERMMDFAFLQLPVRISKTLLRVSAGSGEIDAKPAVRLSLSQSEIADMVGGTRENVNRCLRKWQKSGLIDLKDGWLIILDRPGLQRLTG